MQEISRANNGLMPSIVSLADLTSAQFCGEDQVVLFMPDSGDVFRCSASCWLELRNSRSNESSDLKELLVKLGVLAGN